MSVNRTKRPITPQISRTADHDGRRFACCQGLVGELDGAPDRAQDRADLATQEEEGHDGDDRDKGEDECVLRETLACFLASKAGEKRRQSNHWLSLSLMRTVPRRTDTLLPDRAILRGDRRSGGIPGPKSGALAPI